MEPNQKPVQKEDAEDAGASEPIRVRRFLTFFKGYMSLSSLVVAALPIPVTMLDFIPTYAAQTKLLSVYTSLFCFLLIAFVFYSRHSLARWFFPMISKDSQPKLSRVMTILPLAFIGMCMASLFSYQYVLQQSATKFTRESMARKWELVFEEYSKELAAKGKETPLQEQLDLMRKIQENLHLLDTGRSMNETLKSSALENIPYNLTLIALYLAFFLAAEAAFVLMAIREYLQDLLGLSDVALIRDKRNT